MGNSNGLINQYSCYKQQYSLFNEFSYPSKINKLSPAFNSLSFFIVGSCNVALAQANPKINVQLTIDVQTNFESVF